MRKPHKRFSDVEFVNGAFADVCAAFAFDGRQVEPVAVVGARGVPLLRVLAGGVAAGGGET
jgi:hypothetical protein